VFRGGGWDDAARQLRAANRFWLSPSGRYVNLGFRVAATAPE
jgi:formylglycine-generating enzyme required for sulfatase activity